MYDSYKAEEIRKKTQKERDKKKKNIKKSYLILNKERKTKKTGSKVANFAKILIKNGISDAEGIVGFLKGMGEEVSKEDAKLYSMLATSKVFVDNIKVSDILANRPLKLFVYKGNIKTQCLSNDTLYLRLFYSRYIKEEFNKANKDKKDVEFQNSVYLGTTIESVDFQSVPFEMKGEIKKGYYQDYTEDVAFIGVNFLDDNEKNKLFRGNKVEFSYNESKYYGLGNDSACVIYLNGYENRVKEMFDKMKTIYVEKNSIKEGIRIIKFKDNVHVVSCKVRPESFCPAFLYTPEDVNYQFFYTLKIDYNSFFAAMDKYKTKEVKLMPDLVYWENIPQCFEFLYIYSVTSAVCDNESREEFVKLYEDYYKLRKIINLWKRIQLNFTRLLVDFYHCFFDRINYDKLLLLKVKFSTYIEEVSLLVKDSSYEEIVSFFKGLGSCADMVYRQIVGDGVGLAKRIKDTIIKMEGGENPYSLFEVFRGLLNEIYLLGYSDENLTEDMYPFCLSPGGFLGDNQSPLKSEFAEVVMNIEKKKKKKMVNIKKEEDNDVKMLENYDDYAEQIIANTAVTELNELDPDFNPWDEGTQREISGLYDSIKQNSKENNKLNKAIAQTKTKNVYDIDFKSDIIRNWAISKINEKKKEKLDKDLNIINLEKQKIDLQNKIEDVKKGNRNMYMNDNELFEKAKNWKVGKSTIYTEKENDTGMLTISKIMNVINGLKNEEKYHVDDKVFGTFVKGFITACVRLYKDILALSGKYDNRLEEIITDYLKGGLEFDTFYSKYPLDKRLVEIIINDYNLPTFSELYTRGYKSNLETSDKKLDEKKFREARNMHNYVNYDNDKVTKEIIEAEVNRAKKEGEDYEKKQEPLQLKKPVMAPAFGPGNENYTIRTLKDVDLGPDDDDDEKDNLMGIEGGSDEERTNVEDIQAKISKVKNVVENEGKKKENIGK